VANNKVLHAERRSMKKTTEKPLALARNEELVIQDLPDEVLVYDLKRHKAHCLNKTAAFIWNHCDGQSTTEEIARMMEQEWHAPVNEDAVWFALNKLSKAELLQERIVLPEAKAGMSRRSAMRRLGLGALLIPVVMTIVSPTAMAGASVPLACQQCTVFGSGAGRTNTCPPECDATVLGRCFNNASCDTGGGGLLASGISCPACFNDFPGPAGSSSGWRAP
jgi:hypothetical protein